ncbi:hypothetical protein FXF51_57595 [Nonomuraea sp. PA05]|uniref:hypothetical protein n=1 Tax=Nonomuraea sp. PA05 TaxID=2604466 RepID=UPI0011D3DE1A|nr:hypothetical protein [Nonomuraea sp. PA05]TYB47650.1 hypothetical protein FXF51_57595 [Nonomuraea sp. PA05]
MALDAGLRLLLIVTFVRTHPHWYRRARGAWRSRRAWAAGAAVAVSRSRYGISAARPANHRPASRMVGL